MVKFVKKEVDMGTIKNADAMPYEFVGTNTYSKAITIQCKPSCGCSTMAPWITVPAGGLFKLSGAMTKRPSAKLYRKKVNVFIRQGENAQSGDVIQQEELFFSMNVTN